MAGNFDSHWAEVGSIAVGVRDAQAQLQRVNQEIPAAESEVNQAESELRAAESALASIPTTAPSYGDDDNGAAQAALDAQRSAAQARVDAARSRLNVARDRLDSLRDQKRELENRISALQSSAGRLSGMFSEKQQESQNKANAAGTAADKFRQIASITSFGRSAANSGGQLSSQRNSEYTADAKEYGDLRNAAQAAMNGQVIGRSGRSAPSSSYSAPSGGSAARSSPRAPKSAPGANRSALRTAGSAAIAASTAAGLSKLGKPAASAGIDALTISSASTSRGTDAAMNSIAGGLDLDRAGLDSMMRENGLCCAESGDKMHLTTRAAASSTPGAKVYGRGQTGVGSRGTSDNSTGNYVPRGRLPKKFQAPYSRYESRLAQTPKSGGTWTGKRGESVFILDDPIRLKDGTTIDRITYRNCIPDFSDYERERFEIEVTADRHSNKSKGIVGNFEKADALLAEKWSRENFQGKQWTRREVEEYRSENRLTWHEMNDMKTVELIPLDLNQRFGHLGGCGEYNAKMNQEVLDEFD